MPTHYFTMSYNDVVLVCKQIECIETRVTSRIDFSLLPHNVTKFAAKEILLTNLFFKHFEG